MTTPMLLLASGTADKAGTFVVLFLAQALSWAGVPALGAAAAGAAGALASHGTLHLWAALLWNVGAGLASYGVASAAPGKSALHSVVPIVIGLAALAAIYFLLRALRHRHHRFAEPTVPVA